MLGYFTVSDIVAIAASKIITYTDEIARRFMTSTRSHIIINVDPSNM